MTIYFYMPVEDGTYYVKPCDSNSNSFNPIFTKPGQKLYLDDI